MQDYFPLGMASGAAFCNREDERHHLLSNIRQIKPTLLVSPRRYGKTSLVMQTIAESKLPFAHIDFFSEINQADIVKSILRGIGKAIGKIASTPQRATSIIKEFFLGAKINFSIDIPGISLDFDLEKQDVKKHLETILLHFDALAKKNKKAVILFFDEFQRLGEIVEDHSIEAILRKVAQQSKYIIFIFSGSNRHLLNAMFDDRRRPFYKLCDRIVLQRMLSKHYYPYIQQAAHKRWRQSLSQGVIELILLLTGRHPYYVNLLCSRLWLQPKPPHVEQVKNSWNQLAEEEKSQMALEMDLLSDNQRSLLITLAKFGKTKSLQNKLFISQANMSASSIAQALAVLQDYDYIYRDEEGYYDLVDPLLRRIISGSR